MVYKKDLTDNTIRNSKLFSEIAFLFFVINNSNDTAIQVNNDL